VRERHYGRFSRAIRLPQPVNNEAVDAIFEKGVLRVKLSKVEGSKAISIPITPVSE
jgi:HSP20 family molecular chaperone IbpA